MRLVVHGSVKIALPAALLGAAVTVNAAITLDGTAGPAGALAGPNFLVPDVFGSRVGSNLFHSFGVFDLFPGETATFAQFTGGTIDNVISRVTGGAPSTINGALVSTISGADFYFVNPNGITFGDFASVNVPAAFYATTADFIKLGGDGRFDAGNPAASVLTTSPPSAFGFLGPTPADIGLFGAQISVGNGKDLGLVAGAIDLSPSLFFAGRQSIAAAPGGNLSVLSVASAGTASGSAATGFDVSGFSALGDIALTGPGSANRTLLDASGTGSGRLVIRGGNLTLTSAIASATAFGAGDSRGVDISLTGTLDMTDSGVFSNTLPGATGSAGPISVGAANLSMRAGSFISSGTFTSANAGDVDIAVTANLDIRSGSKISSDALVFSTGNAGAVTITGGSLAAAGAVISSNAQALTTGDAGSISVAVGELDLSANATISSAVVPAFFDPVLGLIPGGTGSSGTVTVIAANATLSTGAVISTSTGGADAGTVDVAVTGNLDMRSGSTISSDALVFSTGDAGAVNVSAGTLTSSGSFISSSTFSSGNAGNVAVSADSIALRADPVASAQILSSTFSTGNAGTLNVAAANLSLDGCLAGALICTSIASNARPGTSGNAGSVLVSTGELTLLNGAAISSVVFPGVIDPVFGFIPGGTGASGSVTVSATDTTLRSGASITTSTAGGNAGAVSVTVANRLDMSGLSFISSDSLALAPGNAGTVFVSAPRIDLDGAAISSSSFPGSTGNAGDIRAVADTLTLRRGAFISTLAADTDGGNIKVDAKSLVFLRDSAITAQVFGGNGSGGNVDIDPNFVVLAGSRLIADAIGGPGGNISILAGHFFASPDSVLSASSAQSIDGTVVIDSPDTDVTGGVTVLPASFLDAIALLKARCGARASGKAGSTLVEAGRGGVPVDPGGYLPSFMLDSDDDNGATSDGEHPVAFTLSPSMQTTIADSVGKGCAG